MKSDNFDSKKLRLPPPFMTLTMALLFSCATLYQDALLADGDTWRIWINDYDCAKIIPVGTGRDPYSGGTIVEVRKDYKECFEIVEERAFELCGKKPHRIFGCLAARDNPNYWQCNAKCNSK